ncbi:Ribonuclease H-like superfamily [Sesbania bispinosa]|nr:Ribonuclease H-like superfamily [Sesbania bispinosa]
MELWILSGKRDFHYAHQIRSLLRADNADSFFFSRDIHSWIASNLDVHLTASHQALCVAQLDKAKACDYSSVYTNSTTHSQSSPYGTSLIRWTLPPLGILKCNVDASVNIHDSSAACGGTLQDCSGSWISDFVKNIGQSSVNIAELWGIFTVLQLGLHISVFDIWVESDSMLAISIILKGCNKFHPYYGIISAIKRTSLQYKTIKSSHTFHEGNRVADALASALLLLFLSLLVIIF